MRILRFILVVFCLAVLPFNMHARNENPGYMRCNADTSGRDLRFYGGFIHQHENFFRKAFSYQGVEAGVILQHSVIFGVFGSTFASSLEVKGPDDAGFYLLSKGGIYGGMVVSGANRLHGGWLINAGGFSLSGNASEIPLFRRDHSDVRITGLILDPQIYAEVNVCGWMKIRTGLDYNFYVFKDKAVVSPRDLQGLSLSFGFLFGRFKP